MDAAITHWINAAAGRDAALDAIMVLLTRFGAIVMVVAVALQWWAKADRYHVRHVALCAGLAFLLGLAINQGIVLFVHRVRPYDAGVTHLLIARSSDWSFPSDHATATVAIAATFAAQGLPRRALLFGLMALAVCASRIYVGTHYLTDVLGGAVTAVAATGIVRWAYREDSRVDRFATLIL